MNNKDKKLSNIIFGGLIFTIVITLFGYLFTSCTNKQVFDTTYRFDKAVIYIGGEWRTVQVDSWKDFEDGDQIQVKDKDGNVYLVHSSNVTLIKEK